MNELEKIEIENKKLISKLEELAQTEDSRASVISAAFIRANNELRLKNIQDIRKDIAYGAKNFGQLPEKYTSSQDSIVKSYVEQTNRFMKLYNEQFLNIKVKLQLAQEKQKILIFRLRKLSIIKQLYDISGNTSEVLNNYDEKMTNYKKKIRICEKIIARCDKEFDDCKYRREQDFNDIFGVGQSLAVIENKNILQRIWKKIKNKFTGYQDFSKYVLQKYADKINNIKTGLMDEYEKNINQNIVNFSEEVEKLFNEVGD